MTATRLVLPLLLAAFLAPAFAGDPCDPNPWQTPEDLAAHKKNEAQGLKWFNMLDANKDGRVSLDEAKAAFIIKPSLRKWFEDTDANHDGYLTQEEVRAEADRRREERRARRCREQKEKQAQESAPAADGQAPAAGADQRK